MHKGKTGMITALLAIMLGGCGGGDGGAAQPVTVSGGISGVAATGAAISGGLVTLKCAGGLSSATTVTNTDGSYHFTVDKITLPCLAQVSYTIPGSGTQTLHTYVSSTGVSNITPLTELLLAQLGHDSPINLFTLFGSSPATIYKPSEINAALTALKEKLLTAGVSLPDNIDPLHALLIAKTDTQAGNSHDELLDALGESLLSKGLRLERLTLFVSHGVALDDDIAGALAQDVVTNNLHGTHTGFLKNSNTACFFSIDASGSLLPRFLPVYRSPSITVPDSPVGDAMSNGHTFILPVPTLNTNNIEISYPDFTGLTVSSVNTSTFTSTHEWHYLKPATPGAFNTSDDFNANRAGYSAILRKIVTSAPASASSPVSGLYTPYVEAHLELEINGLSIPSNSSISPVPTPLTCVGSNHRA